MTQYEKVVSFWKQKNITNDDMLFEAMDGIWTLLSYHSGKIENDQITYNDTREIFDHDGVTSYTGDLRTLFEIRNSKDANEFLLDSFRERHPLDENLIKEFQRLLTWNTYDTRRWNLGERPGEYKKHDYVTGRKETGAAAEDVSEELSELLGELTDIPDEKALTAAAYYHAKFENIHPFADGNGRTGRLTMNYFLLLHDHPPIIIHEEDRKFYYAALECWDEKQELTSLIDFLKYETEKTWEKSLEKKLKKKIEFSL